MKKYLLLICLFGLTLGQLSIGQTIMTNENGVPEQLAAWRKQTYKHVSYDLFFSIPKQKKEQVTGKVDIHLTLDKPETLIIDFRQPTENILWMKINGISARYEAKDEHLIIDPSLTKEGRNTVSMGFIAEDQSLNRNEEFLYTLLVPDRARTLFPCFDQPGIKGTFNLTLNIPSEWKAISNTRVLSEKNNGEYKTITFDKTEPLSTYLFSFVTGKLEQKSYDDGKHKFSAYFRENDSKKLEQLTDIFKLVAASLEWQENYTGIPYPFAKYDLIILPGFQFGGMEHTGATLYNDNVMFLNEHPTLEEELERAKLIAHETSHMWFGDFVTMNWFDDVWTKEVFANHYAACITEPLYPDINHRLNRMKTFNMASLSEDRTPGTTSIKQALDNLNQAGLVYGQIIYNKAPVMMEKMVEIMGEQDFRKGIQIYLKRYAYNNATWNNLIDILDSISSEDLKQFSEVWVNQKGMPDIKAQAEGNKLILTQHDPYKRGIIWPQRFQVTITDGSQKQHIEVNLNKDSVSIPLKFHPSYILPNTDGRGYGRFLLDKQSISFLLTNWWKMEDETARLACLMNLYENYLAGCIRAAEWNTSLATGLATETNELIVSTLTDYIPTVLNDLTDQEKVNAESTYLEISKKHKLTSCRQQLLRKLMYSMNTKETVNHFLYLWEQQNNSLLSERDYTNMAYELALRLPDKNRWILDTQRKRITNPDRLRQFDFISRALSLNQAELDSLFQSLMYKENRRIEPWTATVLSYLNHPLREKESVKYIRPGLEVLQEVQRTGDIFFPRNWAGALLGNHRSKEACQEVIRFLNEHPNYPQLLKNKILQAAYPLFRKQGIATVQSELKL